MTKNSEITFRSERQTLLPGHASPVRLNKFLSEMGICSRREADRLTAEGKITVDGRPAVMGERVFPYQEIVCNGRRVKGEAGRPGVVWLVVNKPRGIVCTTSDKDRAENIIDFISWPQRVFPVGRLDKDSEGLLLLTNEGGLADLLLRGRNAHEKEYLVTVDRPVTQEFLDAMGRGVELPELNTRTRPCRVWAEGRNSFRIILTQGLNRQIRRMCEALGVRVLELKRLRIMNIYLGSLEPGGVREMTDEEYREMCAALEQKGRRE